MDASLEGKGKQMRAYVLHEIGKIRLEEVATPAAKAGEVLVQVQAAGICGSDVPRIYKTGAHVHPLIPGHEFSGKVVALGDGVSSAWLEKPVGVFPLIPCMECGPCKMKKYEMCRHYNYLGSRCDGGFAEYVAVPEKNLIALPEGVTYEEAAMAEPMAVAVHAIRRVKPEPGERVCVYGLGTIGLLITMFLAEKGIEELYVIGNKAFQKKNALSLGVEESHYLDSRDADVDAWLAEKTDGKGIDCFFECVGKNEILSKAIDNAAPAGRVMLVGNPYSDMTLEKSVYWKILRNQLLVTGTWNSSFTHEAEDDWHFVMQMLAEKKVSPAKLISHRLSMEELQSGMELMRDKSEDYVKVMGFPQR